MDTELALSALPDRLHERAATYSARLSAIEGELSELNRLAAASGKRRGDRRPGGDDTQKYRLGSVFAMLVCDLGDLDDLAILGLFADASVPLPLLNEAALGSGGSLVDLIVAILSDANISAPFREQGALLRWQWHRDLYHAEVEAFSKSEASRNPRAAWRRKPPTSRQIYLISEAIRAFELDPPSVSTRGEAYEWLRKVGGNPRFAHSVERKK
ncbi:hypothetical protein M2333_001612 [Sphingobium sp. B11D3B]|uniref:hypothetical protein n=1 Tax=unclassified Sphingobium TaxID=2611147 RepID=UPI002223EF53|nr:MULTISPECIES: hypothetical protein [unclassified Sphingobium]MCW2365834.1 hypothetical protein [Sphingobium sp. B7D2B]MCW2388566.1 hypothetical protein [Sphingobium sp. B11D3B]